MAAYSGPRGSKLQVVIGLFAGLCFFLYGYDQGDLAGLLTIPAFLSQFPQVDTISNRDSLHKAQLQGITIATWNLGCVASAMITVFLGDVLGRKRTMLLGLVFLGIGEIVQASSFSFGQLIAGRFIAGFGNGFSTATVPAYHAECTKAHKRGTLLMVSTGACIAAGFAFSYWMDFAFAWLDPSSASWRVPIAFQLVFVLVSLALLVVLPESPRWLVLVGREEEALEVLGALGDSSPTSYHVRDNFLQIKDAVVETAKTSFSETFSMGDYRHLHRTLLAVMLQVFQQMTGINLILQYFAIMLVQQFAYIGWVARLIAACGGLAFFLASFVAVVGIDRFWGRRSLMMFGASGICGSMILLSVVTFVNNRASLYAGTAFLFFVCIFFAIGWQGMSWLYQVEIVPSRVRGPANALSTAANWLINFVVVFITPIAFHNIGYKTYIIFAVVNAVIIPAVYFLYPETGFRSLEEVDVIFYNAKQTKNPWLSVRRIAANEPLWYDKNGEETFDYATSEWHQRRVRFSDETTASDGERRQLHGASMGFDSENGLSEKRGGYNSSSSGTPQSDAAGEQQFQDGLEDAAPSPTVFRTSTSRERHSRSAGRAY